MQFEMNASVFPLKLDMHIPDLEHAWPLKCAIRSGELKAVAMDAAAEKAAWQLLVNGTPVAQGRCGEEVQWLHKDFTKLVEIGDVVQLKIEQDENTKQHKKVTLSMTLTGHFPRKPTTPAGS